MAEFWWGESSRGGNTASSNLKAIFGKEMHKIMKSDITAYSPDICETIIE